MVKICSVVFTAFYLLTCYHSVSAATLAATKVGSEEELRIALSTGKKVIELTSHLYFEGDLIFKAQKTLTIYGNCGPDAGEPPRSSVISTPPNEGACSLVFSDLANFIFATTRNTEWADLSVRTNSWKYVMFSNLILHKEGVANTTGDTTKNYLSLFMVDVEYSGFKDFNLWDSSLYLTDTIIAETEQGVSLTICRDGPEPSISIFNRVTFAQNLKNMYFSTRADFNYTASLFIDDVVYDNIPGTANDAVELRPGSSLKVYAGANAIFGASPLPAKWMTMEGYSVPLAYELVVDPPIDLTTENAEGLTAQGRGALTFLTGLLQYDIPGLDRLMTPFFSDFPPPPPLVPPTLPPPSTLPSPPPGVKGANSPPPPLKAPTPPAGSAGIRAHLSFGGFAIITLALAAQLF